VILPLYYRSEKQDTRSLVNYLKNHLKEKDKIFVGSLGCIPGMLHYFGSVSEGHCFVDFQQEEFGKGVEVSVSFKYQNRIFSLFQSWNCCSQYVADGSRLWIIADKGMAKNFREKSPCVLKGYFDASFMNYNRFPTDASMYLFLWDPKSPEEKGIEIPID
jgi:hypothetical protein